MKKASKFIMITLLAIIGIVIITFAWFYSNNKIKLKKEANLITPYGEMVKVDGGKMNVSILGKGDKTIVLLPGFMTAAPAIDFKQLTDKLQTNYKVVVVEPLGYGMSDDTTKERTVENITSEIHEALEKMKINNFILMAHSISGVYSLDYIDKYPEEVEGFIGIDSSLPSQGEAEDNGEKLVRFLSKTGLMRLVSVTNPTMMNIPPIDNSNIEQFKYVFFRSIGSNAMTSEGGLMAKNFEDTIHLNYPENLPVLYIMSSESTSPDPTWLNLHKDMIEGRKNSKIEILEGGHYLHHTQSEAIVKYVNSFLNEHKL